MPKLIAFLLVLLGIDALVVVMVSSAGAGGHSSTPEFIFHVLLALLAAASLYFSVRFNRARGVRLAAEIMGAAYAILFGLSLAEIFPPQHFPVSQAWTTLNFIGLLMGIGLFISGLTVRKRLKHGDDIYHSKGEPQ